MRAGPIPFNDANVLALVAGRKSQTRRIAKNIEAAPHFRSGWKATRKDKRGAISIDAPAPMLADCCPYGGPGDLLYVKEKWRIGAWNQDTGSLAIDYVDGPRQEWIQIPNDYTGEIFEDLWIQCSDELDAKGIEPDAEGNYHWEPGESPLRWRSSRYMFRWASRLTLRITDVRVERLQDISDREPNNDCVAEGVFGPGHRLRIPTYEEWHDGGYTSADKLLFRRVWESINGAGSWDANPFVCALSFEVIHKNVDEVLG